MVGKILEDYDSDKIFPVLGFGAREKDGNPSHKFHVNGHPRDPGCQEISGVLAAYRSCINKVELYGPTYFSPTIYHVARVAANFLNGSQYHIILIITDGKITDMEETKSAIVYAALLPISIIIVGVGEANFSGMEELDGDKVPVKDRKGRVSSRDIVQFIPMRKIVGISGQNAEVTGTKLAKEVLAEIPDQFLGYMKLNNIVPKTSATTCNDKSFNLPPDPESVVKQHARTTRTNWKHKLTN